MRDRYRPASGRRLALAVSRPRIHQLSPLRHQIAAGIGRFRLVTELVGKGVTIYGQQEVVKDLIRARLEGGGQVLFEVEDVRLEGVAGDRPAIRFRARSTAGTERASLRETRGTVVPAPVIASRNSSGMDIENLAPRAGDVIAA